MRGKTKRRSRGGTREDCGLIDEWNVSENLKRLKNDEFPTPRGNLSIKGCSTPTVKALPARPVFERISRSKQRLETPQGCVEDPAQPGRHTSVEPVTTTTTKSPGFMPNLSLQNAGATQDHCDQRKNPIWIPDSETLTPSPSSTESLEPHTHPSPSAEHDKHTRHQRLTAFAAKFSTPKANQQSFVDELDNIDADLLAERQKTRDMSIMLEHAREEIDRLTRHLNYRGGQVTDLQQAVQAERDRVTEMCLQREEHEINVLKLMAENRSIKATDLALREKCRTMEEELDDAEDQCRVLQRELEGVGEGSRVLVCQPQGISLPAHEEVRTATRKRKTPEQASPQPEKLPAQQSPRKRQGVIACTDLSLSPEPPISLEELRAFEDAIHQADSVAQQEAFLADLKAEIQARGLTGMEQEERRAVLAHYG